MNFPYPFIFGFGGTFFSFWLGGYTFTRSSALAVIFILAIIIGVIVEVIVSDW